MNKAKNTKLILVNALAWAGAMLVIAYLTKGMLDKDTSFMVTMVMVAGWFVVNSFASGSSRTIKDELACFKKLIGK